MVKTDKHIKQIGARIRSYRELKGYSQDYMARKLHISSSAYSRIERAEVNLTIEKLIQIAEIFKVELEQILFGDDHHSKHSNLKANDPEVDYALILTEKSKLAEAYRQQIELLKEQIEYLKSIIAKK